MAYANEVRVLSLSGEDFQDVDCVLYACWTEVDSAGRSRERFDPRDEQTHRWEGAFTVSFTRGPSFMHENNRAIALGIRGKKPAGRTGFWFRSGGYDTLPTPYPANPEGYVDVVLAPPLELDISTLNRGLGGLRRPIDGGEIESVSVASTGDAQAGRTLTATGTGTHGNTRFTYTLEFRLHPTEDVRTPEQVVDVEVVASSLQFQGNPGGGVEAFVKNLVDSFILKEVTPEVVKTIRTEVASEAFRKVNKLFGTDASSLPEGVVLSIRGIDHLPSGVRAWGALGSFGSVIDKFPRSGTTARPCGSQVLAMQVGPVLALHALRRFRDERLPHLPAGTELRAAYYRHGPEIVRLILSHPRLAARSRRVVVEMQATLATEPVPAGVLDEAQHVLAAVRPHASPLLRAAIDRARADLLPALGDESAQRT